MVYLDRDDIEQLDRLYRIHLINSCSGYKSANLIATKSHKGLLNVAVFSSVTHYGSHPPLLGLVFRPPVNSGHTYHNILDTQYFTINHVHHDIISDAHHTSAKYPAEVSEFDQTALNPVYKNNFIAPFVEGCPVQIGLRFVEKHHIQTNNTILLLGEIQQLYIKETALQKDGFIDLSANQTAAINGLDAYCIPTSMQRFDYQRPK